MRTIDRIEWTNSTVDKPKTLLQKLVSNNKAQILWLIALVCVPIQWCSKTWEKIENEIIKYWSKINAKNQELQKEEQQRKAKDIKDFRERRAKELPNEIYYIKDKAWICYAITDSYVRGSRVKSITTVSCEKVEPYIYR